MIQNYIKIAFRNLLKNKAFSFINIFGLAVSLSVCLLTIMIIKDANSFDRFHEDSERIYRITTTPIRKNGETEHYAASPYTVGKALKEDYSQVERWTPVIRTFNPDIKHRGDLMDARGLFTDTGFFDMFGFELAEGDPAVALSKPFTVVLTAELAVKLFNGSSAIGMELEMPAYDQKFVVTGVLAPFPGKTHFEFDALGSLSTQESLEQNGDYFNLTENWLDYYMTYNFIKVKEGSEKEQVQTALNDIVTHRYKDIKFESRDMGILFKLQGLNHITPGPNFSATMGKFLPVQALWFFTILSLIVMFSACFNYTNLSIARSLTRAKEVGVRKVMGASRKQLFAQFISEAVLMSLLGLGLAYVLLEFIIVAFNEIGSLAYADILFETDYKVVLLFISFSVFVGFLAGLLPAFVLSKFSPVAIIQQMEQVKLFKRVGFRKVLIVSQFSISLIFILVLSVAWKQIDFALAENFGSDRTDIINVSMMGQSYDKLETAFRGVPQVKSISACSHLMGTWQDGKDDVRLNWEDEKIPVRDYVVDHRFLEVFDIPLLAGTTFPENRNQKEELFAVVNEQFLQLFDFESPETAIGESIIIGDSTQVVIKGVVEDFLYKPLVYNLEPLLLRYDPEQLAIMTLEVNTTDKAATIAALERTWGQLEADRSIQYSFYDEAIEEIFMDFNDMANVVGFFGGLGLIIACLGLLGMAIYAVETKAKEISIRKVIGASSFDLIKQLSKGYLWLLVVAVGIATPLSYLIGKALLQTFAFSIPLNFMLFLPGILVLVALGVITIGSQTVKGALANPVDNLRND